MSRFAWLLPALLSAPLLSPLALAQSAAQQQSLTPVAALSRLAQATNVEAAWFSSDFAPALPAVRGGFQSFRQQYGAFQGVDDLGSGQYKVRYANGAVTLEASLNASGQFTKLFLKGSAANSSPVTALTRLAQATTLDPSWFTADFKAALPSIQGGFKSFGQQYGAFQGVDELGGEQYKVRYASGAVTVEAALNATGQFTKLFLKGSAANVPASSSASTASPTVNTPQAALSRLLAAPDVQGAWFSTELLAQVPLTQLSALLASLRRDLGTLKTVQPGPNGTYVAEFAGGTLPIHSASLDNQGRFTGLQLGAAQLKQAPSLSSALADFKALGETVSVVVTDNGQVIGSVNPQAKLAVGSAFKLGVLSELQAQITAGQHRWDEVTKLQAANKSLPSGVLQTWPDGSPLTLHTLAALMVSQSDNTATDTLLNLVGRAGVARRLGLSSVPSTRELFALKNPANAELKAAYLSALSSGNVAQQQAALQRAGAAALPSVNVFASGTPVSPEVEWHVSGETLCQLMNDVAALPLTQINPGLADPSQFKQISFKGGSEGGVLNYTTQVTAASGHSLCLSATINSSKAVNDTAFNAAYLRLLQAVR